MEGSLLYLLAQAANGTVEEADAPINGTIKPKSTPEGMMCAYVSLVVMALLPILVGSFKSVKHQVHQKKRQEEFGEQPETMSQKDAMMFPLIASCALFGLYMLFRIFSKEYINLLMTGYFMLLGCFALSQVMSPSIKSMLPKECYTTIHHVKMIRTGKKDPKEGSCMIDFTFDYIDLISLVISAAFAVFYLMTKHWLTNNLFGIAFAINGVELLHLNTVGNGCILLGGLFFYDVFWVFGTDVMVTVAKSFEAPIKLVFPQDFLEKGLFGTNFAMLGLGDIVIPGIFLAILLRFDHTLNRGSNTYFNVSFLAYILGLVMTIVVMSVFKHAQPALLYLVPFCIIFPVGLALIKGDFKAMFAYMDHPEVPAATKVSTGDKKDDDSDTEVEEETEQVSKKDK